MELFIKVALVALSSRAAVVTTDHDQHESLARPRNNVDDVPGLVAGVVDKLSGQLDELESGQTAQFLIARDAHVPGTVVPTTVAQALASMKKSFKAESAGLMAWVQKDRQRRSNDEVAVQAKYTQTSRDAASARQALDLFLNASHNREAPFLIKVAKLESEERDIEASLQQIQHDNAQDSNRARFMTNVSLQPSKIQKIVQTNTTLSGSLAKMKKSLQMPSGTRTTAEEMNKNLLPSSMKANISSQTYPVTKAKDAETNNAPSRSLASSNLPSGPKVHGVETKKASSQTRVKADVSHMAKTKAAYSVTKAKDAETNNASSRSLASSNLPSGPQVHGVETKKASSQTRVKADVSHMAKAKAANSVTKSKDAETNNASSRSLSSSNLPSGPKVHGVEKKKASSQTRVKANVSQMAKTKAAYSVTKTKDAETNNASSRSLASSNLPSGPKVKGVETKKTSSKAQKASLQAELAELEARKLELEARLLAQANAKDGANEDVSDELSKVIISESDKSASVQANVSQMAKTKVAGTNKGLSRFDSMPRTNISLQVPAIEKPPHVKKTQLRSDSKVKAADPIYIEPTTPVHMSPNLRSFLFRLT